MKNEIRNIIELWMHIIHEKSYKNIDYRKFVTSLYNSFSNQWFTAGKTTVKLSPHENSLRK